MNIYIYIYISIYVYICKGHKILKIDIYVEFFYIYQIIEILKTKKSRKIET